MTNKDQLLWLLTNIDACNQRTSKQVFELKGITMDVVEVVHLETGNRWRFYCNTLDGSGEF